MHNCKPDLKECMMLLVDLQYFSRFHFVNKEENIIIQEASSLQSKYPDDISPDYPYSSFRTAMDVKFKKNYNSFCCLTNASVCCYLIGTSGCLYYFYDVFVILCYSTSASAGRSFSKLKYMTKYLRNFMAKPF